MQQCQVYLVAAAWLACELHVQARSGLSGCSQGEETVGCVQGYLVDAPRLAFDIYVTVQSNASAAVQALHLGPTEPFSATPDAMLSAQLLGDLSSYASMPDFSAFYLMIPSPAGAPAS